MSAASVNFRCEGPCQVTHDLCKEIVFLKQTKWSAYFRSAGAWETYVYVMLHWTINATQISAH